MTEALKLVRRKRFELLTPWFVAKYSIQLSYRRVYEGPNYTQDFLTLQAFLAVRSLNRRKPSLEPVSLGSTRRLAIQGYRCKRFYLGMVG